MKTKALFLAVLCTLFTTATIKAEKIKGNGKVITREVNVSNYEAIRLGGNIIYEKSLFSSKSNDAHTCHYTQKAGKSGLVISIDENLFPLLDISSSNGKLVIKSPEKDRLYPTRFIVQCTSENLKELSISGAMDFILESSLKSDELRTSLSGAGNIHLEKQVEIGQLKTSISGTGDLIANNLTCDQLNSSVSGVGNLTLKGKAGKAKFSVSGKGDVNAYDFVVKEVAASVSGMGDIKINASDKLDASVSGVGNISYTGDPSVNARKSGIGSITKK